ncbi:putative phage abortive infection protein [Acinetobacter baumannii]|uniref:putative phage abortive infection protein n=1 Tax=Acinetobacter baumannii TaxID=470 RepID=UPI0026708A42|nr:putative phage abortive infection protein [Acinetobacter baumannii]MDO5885952.1 putative phage abortive infection protein [Acinetobacter baumannii]HDI1575671.1 hypothetical protein [Acinetobacter baumannii]HDV0601437.1 hypothetical protein [Acinetobacter baumannii]
MNTNNQDQQNKNEKWLIPLFIIGIVVIWCLFPWALKYLTDFFEWNIRNSEDTNFGTFGDTYGALNTLFSGLAFATLIITLILQRKELQLQRKAVQDQQLEIQKSNEIAEQQRIIADQQASLINDQIKEAQRQNFYTLLLKFIEEKNIKAAKLTIRFRNPSLLDSHGNDVFKDFANNFIPNFDNSIIPVPPNDNGEFPSHLEYIIEQLKESYERCCRNYKMKFEETLYFEYIEFILSFINKNNSLADKNQIIQIFLSYFTFHETICMACIASIKMPTLKNYINDFGLLRNINPELLTTDQMKNLRSLFNENAFKKKPSTTATLDFLFDKSEI